MKLLKLLKGDIIFIKGNKNKQTLAIVMNDDKMEQAKIRINQTIRKNLKISFGDLVAIEHAGQVPEIKKFHVLPFSDTIKSINQYFLQTFLIPYFRDKFRPIKKGDLFIVRDKVKEVEFKIVAAEPEFGIVGPKTVLHYEGDPIDRQNQQQQEQFGDDIPELKKFHVLPFSDTIQNIKEDIIQTYLIPYFRDKNRKVKKGDTFIVKGKIKPVEFKIVAAEPELGIVAPTTILFTDGDPIDRFNQYQQIEVEQNDIREKKMQKASIKKIFKSNEHNQQEIMLNIIRVGKYTSNFGVMDCIGTGGFGAVYEGYEIGNIKNKVAIKIINIEGIHTLKKGIEQPKRKFIIKFNQWLIINHEELQKYSGTSRQWHYGIAMERMNGSLKKLIKQNKKFKQDDALQIIWKVVKCYEDLYKTGVIHRDLKPDNILYRKLDDQLTFKLTDFGFARDLYMNPFTHSSTAVLSFGYSSPQLARGEKLTIKTDVYSLGCILFQLIVGQQNVPYTMECVDPSTYQTISSKIRKVLLEAGASKPVIQFLQKCLISEQNKRLSWKQIFEHQIFARVAQKK